VRLLKLYVICTAAVAIFIISCDEESSEDPLKPSPNNSPIIQDQADTSVAMGDTLRLQAYAHDIDGDTISYSLIVWYTLDEFRRNYHADVNMDSETGHFWFFPQDDDKPIRSFSFVAKDDFGGSDSTKFAVAVSD